MDEEREVRVRIEADADDLEDAAAVVEDTPGVEAHEDDGQVLLDESSEVEQTPLGELVDEESEPEEKLSLAELQRFKADLENDRKRMLREQTRALEYAAKDLAKRLIPVIDHFKLAIEHGEGGEGITLALKELLDVLAAEGFEEIEVSEGTPFDPQIHHALASHVDPSVAVETVAKVHRAGYRFKDLVLRSPEVLVAQPPQKEE
jgi:molecular chaperone GrpE